MEGDAGFLCLGICPDASTPGRHTWSISFTRYAALYISRFAVKDTLSPDRGYVLRRTVNRELCTCLLARSRLFGSRLSLTTDFLNCQKGSSVWPF